jgi:signal transduction histidine kinase
MLNLVSNACKFTDEGRVTIHLQQKTGGEVLLTVQDTGPGIAPEDHTAIFETFRQTEVGLRHSEGTGLGLPISLRLAEAHGGRLWCDSTLGQGGDVLRGAAGPVAAPA